MPIIDEKYFKDLFYFFIELSGVAVQFAKEVIAYFRAPIEILAWSAPLYVVMMSSIVDIVLAYTIVKWVIPT